jgi:cohesin complex subunit SA-1/2
MQAVLLYYFWILRSVQDKVKEGRPLDEIPNYDEFTSALVGVIDARPKLDGIRLHAIGVLLDLYTSFASLRTIDTASSDLSSLVMDVPPKAAQLILSSFSAAEKAYAKKLNRSIEVEDADAPEEPESAPEDSDEESEEEDVSQAQRLLRKKHEMLMAEKRLVELTSKIVIAIIGRVLDYAEPARGHLRKRIVQNKMKLGANFKEVLQYLEGPKPKRANKPRPANAAPNPAAATAQPAKSAEVVVEDDEDEIEEVEEGGEEDLRRRELQDDIDESDGEEAAAPPAEEPEDEIMGE